SQTFTFSPNNCYEINQVLIDGTANATAKSNGSHTFSNVTANHTISVSFTQKSYSITASAGNGGSISPNGAASVNCGDSKIYTFTPNSGYEIDQVFIDGTPDATAKANGYYIFTNVTANHNIIVTFKDDITGTEVIRPQGISIYPNPATNDLFIKSDLPVKKVEIYSLTGNLVILENNFTGKISVSALPRGIYLIKVYTGKGVTINKVIRN
ncbi:MAG: T9SS type A sorting domain-containing protein, partial [Tannerella sp.]|nr:T9SS type A sorting domain-containing protein [Tannerella sp.]